MLFRSIQGIAYRSGGTIYTVAGANEQMSEIEAMGDFTEFSSQTAESFPLGDHIS